MHSRDHVHENRHQIEDRRSQLRRFHSNQTYLSIRREIIHVRHARNSSRYRICNLCDESICIQFQQNSLKSRQAHFSLFARHFEFSTNFFLNHYHLLRQSESTNIRS